MSVLNQYRTLLQTENMSKKSSGHLASAITAQSQPISLMGIKGAFVPVATLRASHFTIHPLYICGTLIALFIADGSSCFMGPGVSVLWPGYTGFTALICAHDVSGKQIILIINMVLFYELRAVKNNKQEFFCSTCSGSLFLPR